MHRLGVALAAAAVGLAACTPQDEADTTGSALPASQESAVLGPVDGRDLPGVDLERVRVGDLAPDFSLRSLAGPVVTLSDFRGSRNVILVFYRGYW